MVLRCFFFNGTATTESYTYGHTLSLHDALPISHARPAALSARIAHTQRRSETGCAADRRSEEHTSELQSLMRISYAVFCLKKNDTIAGHTDDQFARLQISHEFPRDRGYETTQRAYPDTKGNHDERPL